MADYTLDDVLKMAPAAPQTYSLEDVQAMQPKTLSESPGMIQKLVDWAKDDVSQIPQRVGNLAAGAVRGAGSIGATILYPLDKVQDILHDDRGPTLSNLVTGQQPLSRNEQRRADMTDALKTLGADPDSLQFRAGKLGAEVAGTAGMGGALSRGLGAAGDALGYGSSPAVQAMKAALETGGFNAGPLAGTWPGVAARIAGGAINGGATAGAVNPEDAGAGALIGGALPAVTGAAGGLGSAINRAVRGDGVSPEVAALAQKAKDLGVQIPADRLVNSRPLNAFAASLNYVPLSGRAATEDAMNSQLNQALSRTFGQDSPNVTMALRKANDALGAQFETTLKNNTVRVDPQFLSDLAESANKASRELGTDGASIIGKQVDDIMSKASTGEIDGQAAYNIKKTLDRIGNRNTPEAYYATDLKRALMGALDRSLGPDEAAAFAQTRQHYGNMLDLEKLAKNGAEGGVSVARLANMTGINNQPMQDLADIAAQFVKPREGMHGAAQRVSMGGMAAGLGGWIGGPLGAATTAGTLAGTGRLANTVLNSDAARRYMLQGALSAAEPSALSQAAYRVAPLLATQD